MRYIIFSISLLGSIAITNHARSQNANNPGPFEITVNLGTFAAKSVPAHSEFVQPFSAQIEFSKSCRLSKTGQQWLQAGLGVQSISAVTDHYFNQRQGNIVFEPLPSAYNYNRYQQIQLQLPILFKQVLFSKNADGVSLNAGIVPAYIISSNNNLRGNGETVAVKQLPGNALQWGGRLEFSSINLQKTKPFFIWGAGMQYQFSDFLDKQQSFKPLTLYFKIGVGF